MGQSMMIFKDIENTAQKKIKKLRKGLKLVYGKGKKYEKKDVVEHNPNDPKMLHAMDLRAVMQSKQDDSGNRIKFHVAKKILKAYKQSQRLKEICDKRTEKQTSLEAEAYQCYMGGFYQSEKEKWEEALQNFIRSRQIYQDLVKKADSLKGAVFKEKIEQLDQNIRYCYQQQGGSIFDSIDVILSKLKGDKVIVEQNEQQQQINKGLLEIEFHGEKFPIKNPKVINIYQNTQVDIVKLRELQVQLRKESTQKNLENALNLFIELFSKFDDIIKQIAKEKEDPKHSETEKQIYNGILNYFYSQKFQYQLQRNALNIRQAVMKFESEQGLENLQDLMTKKAFKLKLTRPAEIVKLCDNYLQVMKQLMEIERHNPNLETFRKFDKLEIFYKGIRCFYVSTVYYANQKMKEALSLLAQTDSYFEYALQKQEEFDQHLNEFYEFFSGMMNAFRIKIRIEYLNKTASGKDQEEQITKKVADMSIKGKTSYTTIENMVQESFQGVEHCIDINKMAQTPITEIPPKPTLSGCKSIFFDLAHQNLQYPDVSKKVKEEKQGFFSKFNFFKK